MSETGNRLDRLRTSLGEAGLDGFLVTHPPNLRYLFGFTGSLGAALVTEREAVLLVDSRYIEQAEQETEGCLARRSTQPLGEDLRDLLSGPRHVGIEADTVTYAQALTWLSWSGPWHLEVTYGFVERLRAIKSPAEIEYIRNSCRLARTAHARLIEELSWGVPERVVAARLEFLFREHGAEGVAFDTIVASGPNSSLPHARPGDRRIRQDEVLLIDFGARKNGYCSDLTRVLPPDHDEVLRVMEIVEGARQAAFSVIRPGISTTTVDQAAREVITRSGYGKRFGHGTGHGLGLEIHERPRVSTSGDSTLESGMVLTIEPGIYLPGTFGIRIEDVVVVTEDGYELLSG